jgi:hypothetical protein
MFVSKPVPDVASRCKQCEREIRKAFDTFAVLVQSHQTKMSPMARARTLA